MGAKSSSKGKKAEYALRDKLRSLGFMEVERGSVLTRTQDVYGLLGIHIECKACSKLDLSGWLSQSINSAEKRRDGLPVIMYRQVDKTHRGLPWLVTMLASDWEKLGGRDFFATTRAVNVYGRMEQAKENGHNAIIDHLVVGTVVTMELDDWAELYKGWKLPFTED